MEGTVSAVMQKKKSVEFVSSDNVGKRAVFAKYRLYET